MDIGIDYPCGLLIVLVYICMPGVDYDYSFLVHTHIQCPCFI